MTKTVFEKNCKMNTLRYLMVFALLTALLIAAVMISVNTGNVDISPGKLFHILFFKEGSVDELNIVWKIRLPRIIMAGLLGGALALSGFLLQTFFENPIAGPIVLGISSGAKMAVALVMVIFLKCFSRVSSWTLILAAFCGALFVTGFILAVSKVMKNMAALLVAGIMVGYICSAVTDFVVTFAADSDIVNLHGWSQGSFSGMNWDNVKVAGIVVIISLFLAFLMSKPIGAFALGEDYAASVGVNVKRFRVLLILLSSVLSAVVTAFAGPISFVGIAVPFLVKSLLGTSKPLMVIPGTFLLGGVFCLFCDLAARMAFAPTELKISTVTSFVGAPIVIFMLIRRQRRRG